MRRCTVSAAGQDGCRRGGTLRLTFIKHGGMVQALTEWGGPPRGYDSSAPQMLEAFLELTEDAAFSKSLDGTILSWNAGAEHLYGYAPAEVIGRPVTLLFPEGRRDEVDYILRELALGRPVLDHETVRIRRDGRHVYISLRAAPIFDSTGAVTHASVIA